MDKPQPIRSRERDLVEGSTLVRGLVESPATVGSTASLDMKRHDDPIAAEGTQMQGIDSAKTVIRRRDSEGSSRSVRGAGLDSPASVAAVLLGTRLNHFYLEEMIGGGGMGAVFRGNDERLDRTVAIKVIPFVGDDPELQRRFRNEAQSAARLDHPHIAKVFDVGRFDQWHYIVFEHIEGTNIRDLVARDGVLSIDDAVYFTRQIAEALEHIDSRGIVHRDIKPSNVLVNADGNVKLVDMGLARSHQLEWSGDMTASGVTLGTFDYISPEQARDPREADIRSDIYSLGCTLYFMLTGSPPYPGGTMLQKLLSHGNSPPPDPRGLRPEVSSNLTAIIHKMLAKDPGARYRGAIDLIADLRELAFREGLPRAQTRGTISVASSDPIPQVFLRHLPWIVGVAMLAISAVWLQITASLRRDEFDVVPPPSAVAMRIVPGDPLASPGGKSRTPGAVDPLPEEIDRGDSPSGPSIDQGIGEFSGLESEDVASVPPAFAELAMPRDAANRLLEPRSFVPIAPVAAIERIVVGGSEVAASTRHADTLRDALRLSEELNVNLIEIAQPVITSLPVRIGRDGLTIRSIVGGSEIRFVSGETLSMERQVMMNIGSNRIELQGLHLVWNVPSTTLDGGTLFAVTNNRQVLLSDCTITIENLAQRDEVFAFEVSRSATASGAFSGTLDLPDPYSGTTTREDPSGAPTSLPAEAQPLVAIELSHVIARGEMTLVNLVDPVELEFRWENGLLVVSRRMLDAIGSDIRPTLAGNPIRLSFNRVTSITPEGFARMRLGPSGAWPMLIDRESRSSVYRCDPASPYIEFSGVETIPDDPSRLVLLRGEDNAYDFDLTVDSAMLAVSQWNGDRQQKGISDFVSGDRNSWAAERSPRWVVRWSTPLPTTIPPSKIVVSDYYQDGSVVAGFDRATLPPLPTGATLPFEP